MIDWRNLPSLEPERSLFRASDGSFHSVPSENLWMACEIDPDLVVLGRSPERLTQADREMLRDMGISWDDPMLEEYVLALLPVLR